MNRKLIFFDLDGTIIGEKSHIILDSTKEAIRLARKNGHLAIVNTGRTLCLIGPEIMDIGFDGYILGCGSMISYNKKELFHKLVPRERHEAVKEGLRKYRIDAVLEGPHYHYIDDPERFHTEVFKEFVTGIKDKAKSWQDQDLTFEKFFSYVGEYGQVDGFREEFADLFDLIDRENGYWEAVPAGCSKAGGIRFLSDYLKISMEDTVAIGDSNNDISMLNEAHIAIAMGNSSEEALKIADYVTADVEEDGIFHALKWLRCI